VQLADLAVKEDLTKVKGPQEVLGQSVIYLGRGLAAYRAGDWDGALTWCRKSRQDIDPLDGQAGQAQNLLIEAMALHRLEKPREAKASLDKAIELKHQAFPTAVTPSAGPGADWENWLAIELFQREAQELLDTSITNDQRTGLDDTHAADQTP
jgi:hypothetical protein